MLRCDVYRYFPAIDHEILKADLRRRIACPRTLALADRIIDGSNPQEPVIQYYPGDDLSTPYERRRGVASQRLLPNRATQGCRSAPGEDGEVGQGSAPRGGVTDGG